MIGSFDGGAFISYAVRHKVSPLYGKRTVFSHLLEPVFLFDIIHKNMILDNYYFYPDSYINFTFVCFGWEKRFLA